MRPARDPVHRAATRGQVQRPGLFHRHLRLSRRRRWSRAQLEPARPARHGAGGAGECGGALALCGPELALWLGAPSSAWRRRRRNRHGTNPTQREETRMISRRDLSGCALATGPLGLRAHPRPTSAWSDRAPSPLRRRTPGAVGLGSSATFAEVARNGSAVRGAAGLVRRPGVRHRAVLRRVGAVAGGIAGPSWASPTWCSGRPSSTLPAAADPRRTSFQRICKPVARPDRVNLGTLAACSTELRRSARALHRCHHHHPAPVRGTDPRREPIDFIGIDYAIDNRRMEERILPLAQDRGVGVLVYAPFGRTRLWQRVRGQALPAWAAELHSWGSSSSSSCSRTRPSPWPPRPPKRAT